MFSIYENSQKIFSYGVGRTKTEVLIQLWRKVPGNNSKFKLVSEGLDRGSKGEPETDQHSQGLTLQFKYLILYLINVIITLRLTGWQKKKKKIN